MKNNNELFNKNCVVLDMCPTSKEDAIRILVDKIASAYDLKNKEAILASVLYREKLASTGLESGIAIPHAKTGAVTEPIMGIGIVKDGIDFNAIDNKKTNIIVLMLSPLQGSSTHLMYLASISSLLSKQEVRDRLINAKSVDDVEKEFCSVC